MFPGTCRWFWFWFRLEVKSPEPGCSTLEASGRKWFFQSKTRPKYESLPIRIWIDPLRVGSGSTLTRPDGPSVPAADAPTFKVLNCFLILNAVNY